jgi:MinD-like ATPase involved in chromosome partitioning or flagellar assembly/CheY-like chemotaxis protein
MADASCLLIIENEQRALNYLSEMFTKAGYTVLVAPSGKEGLIEAWRNRPAAIIIDPALPDLDGLELVRKLRADARTAAAKLLIVSVRSKPEDVLTGMQAGADEYIIRRPGAEAELLERIQALFPVGGAAPPGEAGGPGRAGKLISFLSAKGGTGTSSLCANMAHILAKQVAPKTVVVVDLVLPIGSISQIVGVDAANTIVEATQLDPKDLTPAKMLDLARMVPEWHFHLLAGSRDPEAAQILQVNRLETMFEALRQAYDYVLVDFGRALSRISLPIIRNSARTVMVLSADISTVALSKTTLKYLELQGLRRIQIYPILNRAVGLEGMGKTDMEKELALNIPNIVPHMGGAFAQANNAHQAIVIKLPNDSATFAIHSLTMGLLAQVDETLSTPSPA